MHVIEKLGITDEVNKKSRLVAAMRNAEPVAKGEADLAVQLSHELLAVPGIQFVPMPPEFQNTVVFSAGLSRNAKEPDAAKALIQRFSRPSAVPVIRAHGAEPG